MHNQTKIILDRDLSALEIILILKSIYSIYNNTYCNFVVVVTIVNSKEMGNNNVSNMITAFCQSFSMFTMSILVIAGTVASTAKGSNANFWYN
jgi:hypothetical protein